VETAATLDTVIQSKARESAALDEEAEHKKKQLAVFDKKTAALKKEAATVDEVENMVKPTLFGGNLQISPADWKKASNLAKEGVKSRGIITGLKKQITDFISKVAGLETKLKHRHSSVQPRNADAVRALSIMEEKFYD
jgi:hypothetical protein